MHTFRYQAHAHGGTRLLAACAEQDEQVVDGKMSVEMRRLLPTSPPAFLSSCLLVPPALQTRIYTALQQVARQWRDFNLINSRPQGEDSLCTRCLEEYGVHQFANYHLTLIALASGKWDEVNIRYDDQAIANSKKYETRGNSVDRTTLTSRFCVSFSSPPPRRLALPPFWPRS